MKTPKYQENPKLEKLRIRSILYEDGLTEIIGFLKLHWFALAELWQKKICPNEDQDIFCKYGLKYEEKYGGDYHWNPRLYHWNPRLWEVNNTIFSKK